MPGISRTNWRGDSTMVAANEMGPAEIRSLFAELVFQYESLGIC